MEFKEIKASELGKDPFTMISKQWMLVTTGDVEKYNTMTASWGGFGYIWNKEVATIYIRPSRYTKELLDSNATCSRFVRSNR